METYRHGRRNGIRAHGGRQRNGGHGPWHGTVAFLAGGGVQGGRVLADWPGLKTAKLYEGRDLEPTTDLRGVIKGVMADHLGLSAAVSGGTSSGTRRL